MLYGSTNLAFEMERPAVNAARTFLQELRAARSGLKGAAAVKLGQAALRLETALGGSQIGSKLEPRAGLSQAKGLRGLWWWLVQRRQLFIA